MTIPTDRREVPDDLATMRRDMPVDAQLAWELKRLRAQGLDPADFAPRLVAGVVRLVRKVNRTT